MGLGFGLRCWPECLNGSQKAGGRSTKLFSELQCQMGNGKFSIYHLTFLMSLKSKKTELPAVCRLPPASCLLLLLPAPASCRLHVPCSLRRNSSLIAIVSVRRFANRRLSRKSIGKPPGGVFAPNAGLEKIAASCGFNLCGTP